MAEVEERPILFNGPMVRAILAGNKAQTRRTRGLEYFSRPENDPNGWWCARVADGHAYMVYKQSPHERAVRCPYGQTGDRLWVRETWQHANYPFGPYQDHTPVLYRANYLDDAHGPDGELSAEGRYREWRPSIHMPRTACRLVLEITAVRVKRLQAIGDSDALAEGVGLNASSVGVVMTTPTGESMPRLMFRALWEQINGADAWDANPWVWVVEFRVLPPRMEGGGHEPNSDGSASARVSRINLDNLGAS
ncbi:hypothetical protein [Achromobacter spanius]